ncbi:MAG: LD-carboxypeptidase [Kofleriaceae bacterium]
MGDLLADAITPPPVPTGAKVGVCAPSGPCPPSRLRPGVDLLGAHLRLRLGPVAQRLLDGGAPQGFLAGSDDERADELNALLRDPDVRAIVMARGGHGLSRILDRLDVAALRADPKPLLGFSDGTALLAWALHAGVRPLHGPVLVQLADLPTADLRALVDALLGAPPPTPLATELVPLGAPGSVVAGRLVAGNLTMLAQLVGTPWAMPMAGALLAIEDVGERPYAIDRDLTQLANAGALAQVEAVMVGDLTRCTDPPLAAGAVDDPAPALATVDERLRAAGRVGARGLPIGHGARNHTLPLGARARLDLETRTLQLDD